MLLLRGMGVDEAGDAQTKHHLDELLVVLVQLGTPCR